MGLKLTLARDDVIIMSGGIVIKVNTIYNQHVDTRKNKVQLEVAAPRQIKVFRFHDNESDERLVELLSKFTETDNKEAILKALEDLLYE